MFQDFNQGWLFRKEGEAARTVDLPHDAMLEEPRTFLCHNGDRTGYFPGGKYEYVKTFSLSPQEAAGYVALRFGGVYRHAAVFCNGKEIVRQQYGYVPFTADLSGSVRPGENEILVTTDNSLEPNSRWYSGSGIYRGVSLRLCAGEPIRNVRIETKSIDPAIVSVSVENDGAAIEIYEGETLVVSGTPGELTIPGAKLWSAEAPNLYSCVIKTTSDEVSVPFGIRLIAISPEHGLTVNGETVKLRGGCVHHDNGVLGACSFPDAEKRRVRILKDCGYNAVRCSHNPCSDELLRACDELGMYVMDEAYDGWYTPKNHHDSARDFDAEYASVLTAMVERDRSHPSVILYSIGNEVTEVGEEKGVRLAEAMQNLVHRLDPSRPVTCGVNAMLTVWGRKGLWGYRDKTPYQPVPLPDTEIKLPKSGSALFNALLGKLGRLMNLQTKGRQADRALSGISRVLDILGLNYGFLRYRKELSQNPGRILLGTENRIDSLPEIWPQVMENSAILGDFCWTAMDYIGEAGIGYWNYPSEKGLPLLAGCGAVDLIGIPDAMNIYQQIIWDLRAQPWIGVCPMDHNGEHPMKKAWRFTNVIPSWTWPGHEGEKACIEVFNAAPGVELYLNGKRIGRKTPKKGIARFHVFYEAGTLEAVAYDKAGMETGRSGLKTAKAPALHIRSDRDSLRANGQDLAYVMIELADEDGLVSPVSGVPVSINCIGAGCVQGFGSAACITDESFTDHVHTTFQGRCLAVLRAGYEPGTLTLTVNAEQYGTAQLCLTVTKA